MGESRNILRHRTCQLLHAVLFITLLLGSPAISIAFEFLDDGGNTIDIDRVPLRVISLVPSVTEMLNEIEAGDRIVAVTYHDTYPVENVAKTIVGGYFAPSLDLMESLNPDVIFYSALQKGLKERFKNTSVKLIQLETKSMADGREKILLLGKIFEKETQARELVKSIDDQLQVISEKVAKIPAKEQKRVIRLMGRDAVLTPGSGSFQNEMIRAAGGIPPSFGRTGAVTPVSMEEWVKFNPQVIYGCGGDRKTAERFLTLPGWKDVDAVKNGKIFYFPCALTCRAATNTGRFVSWLSSRIYGGQFSKKAFQVRENKIHRSRDINIQLDYIKKARIIYSTINDFVNKSLRMDFTRPMTVISTLEGERVGIQTVGNHYSPPPCWGIEHHLGLARSRDLIYDVLGVSSGTASFLFTGADMDYVAVVKKRFKDMVVYALVTAGVKSNAVRMGRDEGKYYEPGTINIIILTNTALSTRAMTRAIISATEAKTAAMMDLDVRSTPTPATYQATGTGTDNMLLVQGTGTPIQNAGGHSKMGELIAKAVYQGVLEAVSGQNALVPDRSVFQRLYERHITPYELVKEAQCDCMAKKGEATVALEEILMDPRYTGFLESAFALSNDYDRGLIQDLSSYKRWCKAVAEEIAARKIPEQKNLVRIDKIPLPLKMSLNAILNGISFRNEP